MARSFFRLVRVFAAVAGITGITLVGCGSQSFDFYPTEIETLYSPLLANRHAVWPTGKLEICYLKPIALEVRLTIEHAARLWENGTGVRFTFTDFCDDSSAHLCIGTHSSSSVAAWSYVGTQSVGKRPSMSFDVEALGDRLGAAAAHEFGHALGFEHENSRNDRPKNCSAHTGPSANRLLTCPLGRFDARSILNLCDPHYLDRGARLSRGDLAGARVIYPPAKRSRCSL